MTTALLERFSDEQPTKFYHKGDPYVKRLLLAMLICTAGPGVLGADTDGDGLLDLLDAPGFNPSASGEVDFSSSGIDDLDGASLLANATQINLYDNFITSVESGDFEGLANLQTLNLSANQITSVENRAFQGLANLQTLNLTLNQITSVESGDFEGLANLQTLNLNFNRITSVESGDFEGLANLQTLNLWLCRITSVERGDFQGLANLQRLSLFENSITSVESGDFEGLTDLRYLDLAGNGITSLESGAFQGLANLQRLFLYGNRITHLNLANASLSSLLYLQIDNSAITSLILDHVLLSLASFDVIVSEVSFISQASLVGLNFSGASPDDLAHLLTISTLKSVRVDRALFDRYAAEFTAFAAVPGHTLTIVPEPSSICLDMAVALIAAGRMRRRRQGARR